MERLQSHLTPWHLEHPQEIQGLLVFVLECVLSVDLDYQFSKYGRGSLGVPKTLKGHQ